MERVESRSTVDHLQMRTSRDQLIPKGQLLLMDHLRELNSF